MKGLVVTGIVTLMLALAAGITGAMLHNEVLQTPAQTYPTTSQEASAPGDHVSERDITVLDDKVIIRLDNPYWARFAATGSMKPVFDHNANAIEVEPESPEQIKPGDIISYKSELAPQPVIHRVIETGTDENGWYALTKGDNNEAQDPEKIRFSQVKRLVVAIIY